MYHLPIFCNRGTLLVNLNTNRFFMFSCAIFAKTFSIKVVFVILMGVVTLETLFKLNK